MIANDTVLGVMYMIGAMLGFAIEDAFIKAAADHLPTSQVLILLGFTGAAIFAALCRHRKEPIFSSAALHRSVLLRNLFELLGTCCFVSAIVLMPLATPIAIFQAIPLMVTLGAVVFLGAQVGWRRWSAILVGFLGVLIVVRPGAESFQPASLLAVAATICLAARDLVTRSVPSGISSVQLATYGFASFGMSGVIMLPFWGTPSWIDPVSGALLVGGLVAGMLGYYAITAASRIGDIAVVTPFRYTRLLFAITLGILFFNEHPDAWTLFGAGLILVSGIYALLREQNTLSRPLFTGNKAR